MQLLSVVDSLYIAVEPRYTCNKGPREGASMVSRFFPYIFTINGARNDTHYMQYNLYRELCYVEVCKIQVPLYSTCYCGSHFSPLHLGHRNILQSYILYYLVSIIVTREESQYMHSTWQTHFSSLILTKNSSSMFFNQKFQWNRHLFLNCTWIIHMAWYVEKLAK